MNSLILGQAWQKEVEKWVNASLVCPDITGHPLRSYFAALIVDDSIHSEIDTASSVYGRALSE